MELTFKSGVVSHEPIPSNNKNQVKILLKTAEGETEGIWAMLDDEDNARYKDDECFEMGLAVLLNHSLCGLPWGCYLPIQFNGDSRPVCQVNEHFDENTVISYPDWVAQSILESYLAMFRDDKIPIETAKSVFERFLPLAPEDFDASEIHDLMGK
jgi:hypothetical protein